MSFGIFIAGISGVTLQIAAASVAPDDLSGVVIFSCVTTVHGSKVDEATYKIDFAKQQVNNEPVDITVDDMFIRWSSKKSSLPRANDGPQSPPTFTGSWGDMSLDRFSGKLDSGAMRSGLTTCRVAGRRKF